MLIRTDRVEGVHSCFSKYFVFFNDQSKVIDV